MTKAAKPRSTSQARLRKNSQDTSYADAYRNTDFRNHPEKYRIGRGEQGVLIAEPYKSEILPHWKFATIAAAETSAARIFEMFVGYRDAGDFVGMDMARKFLQMGFTRARRYANHSSGHKYAEDGTVRAQDKSSEESPKAASSKIFYEYYTRARNDAEYRRRLAIHKTLELTRESK